MKHHIEAPFDSIENAQHYLKLLDETVAEAKRDIANEVTLAENQALPRRVEALRIVEYNLEKLRRHLSGSARALNDLRSLRRFLLEERRPPKEQAAKEAKPRPPELKAQPLAVSLLEQLRARKFRVAVSR